MLSKKVVHLFIMKTKLESNFFQLVYQIVGRIPCGKVVTYGDIACFLGNPRNARLVGYAMHSCPEDLPWHRVVMKAGKLPFFGTNPDLPSQKELLEKEGITFYQDERIKLSCYQWKIEISA